MAYVIGPLIDWVSIRRAFVGGAGRLRREARALGIIGGGGRGGGASSRSCRVEGASAADDPAVSSCAECGANPAKVSAGVRTVFRVGSGTFLRVREWRGLADINS